MNQTTVTRSYTFSMGHRLQHHDGLCLFPHGHTYGADVTVERFLVAGNLPEAHGLQREGPGTGMVVDFHRLDPLVAVVLARWDHAFMVERGDPVGKALVDLQNTKVAECRVVEIDGPPTAENIAWEMARQLRPLLERVQLRVTRVTIHEGPKSSATVEPR